MLISEMGKTPEEEETKKPEPAKPSKKSYGWLKNLAWVVGALLVVIFIWSKYTSFTEKRAIERERLIKARQEYCAKNIWANGCVPKDTVFSREVVAGSAQTVVIPPGYRLDWWDTDGCESFTTRREKVGILVFRYFEVTQGIERTMLHFHLFKPDNQYEVPKTECSNKHTPTEAEPVQGENQKPQRIAGAVTYLFWLFRYCGLDSPKVFKTIRIRP